MNDKGWFITHRGWMDSPMFDKQVFDQRSAWMWLVERAGFKAKQTQYVGTHAVQVGRGEIAVSLSYLSKCWGWNLGKVRHWLKRLESQHALRIDSNTICTHLTLCNYSKYQDIAHTKRTLSKQLAASEQHANNNKNKQLKEIKETKQPKGGGSSSFVLEFDEIGPKRLPPCIEEGLWDDLAQLRVRAGVGFSVADQRTTLTWLMKLDADGYNVSRIMERCIGEGRYTFQATDGDKK